MDTGCVSQNILLAWLSGHNVRHYFVLVELVSGWGEFEMGTALQRT
jgi:hypothetical protein